MPDFPDRRSVLAGLAVLPCLSALPLRAAPVQRPFNLRIVMSGHSLTDPIPDMLTLLVKAAAGEQSRGMVIDRSTTPGSTMKYRWQPDSPMDVDARAGMAGYDLLVVTERVPVRSAIAWEETEKYAQLWFDHAWKTGNRGKGAETVFYASWISVISGPGNQDKWDMPDEREIPFRERLDLEMASWQAVADRVNAGRPQGSPPMRVIPGPKLMAAVHDAIKAGSAPGLSDMKDLFEDDIHINAKGAYMIAVAHFAVIYGRDPREIPDLRGAAGWPSAQEQGWMKALVWDVLTRYPDSGLA